LGARWGGLPAQALAAGEDSCRVIPRTPELLPAAPTMLRMLFNYLGLHERDALFAWLRVVRAAVEEHKRKREEERTA
jgi:hypothetical protein